MKYQVIELGNGWYDFKNLPQGYIKIHGLNCKTEQQAIKRARQILADSKANIEIIKV